MTSGVQITGVARIGVRQALLVAEVFGASFQGEGPSVGRRATFIRLSRCNLSCAWCDTPYTWDWSRFSPARESSWAPAGALVDRVLATDAGLVVVTGGEPLLQAGRLAPVVATLAAAGREIEIETNGTLAPPAELAAVARFNVSPKLANSGIDEAKRIKPEVLRLFAATPGVAFKFVVTSCADLEEIAVLEAAFGLGSIWVMAEGTDHARITDLQRAVAGDVLARGWNLSPRLHVQLWGDERGR